MKAISEGGTMRKKLSLSNTEQQEYNDAIERLTAVGVIPPAEKPSHGARTLIVEPMGGPTDSFVHAPSVGGYGIAIWVRIIALISGINVCDCEVTPQWGEDNGICLVDMPERVPYYTVPGGFEYPLDEVLNHRFFGRRYLKRGQMLQGVVIAQSFGSPPAWCINGISIGVELHLFDQFGNPHPLKVDLRLTRDATGTERPRHFAGLYGPSTSRESMGGAWSKRPELGGRPSLSRESNVPHAKQVPDVYRHAT
jgi:hypothetical protein